MRKAIAMIELIFAMVIIGIALLSAPMLISTASKSVSAALQQEGVNQAATRLNMILTYKWDDQNNNFDCYEHPSILTAYSGDSELKMNSSYRRAGISNYSNSHTFECGKNMTYSVSPKLGLEPAEKQPNDIDDFSGMSSLVKINKGSTDGADYVEKNTVRISTKVVFASDYTSYNGVKTIKYNFKPSGAIYYPSNIKMVSATLSSNHSSEELQKNITLYAFSCNLGSYQYVIRTMP